MTNTKFYLNLPDHNSFPKALPLILRIRVIRSSRELEVKNRDARFFQACPDSSESLGSDKYSLPKPHIPTGGRLYHFRKAWKNISTDKWTQSVIRNGQVQSAKATHTDWRQTVSFSEGLEKHLNRQMDTVCNKKRVQDSISCPSQIDKGSASVFESNTLRSREDSTSTDRS